MKGIRAQMEPPCEPLTFTTVPFDVTVRVSDQAVLKLPDGELADAVRGMMIADVARAVGIPRSDVDYDKLTVTVSHNRDFREWRFRATGTWVKRHA